MIDGGHNDEPLPRKVRSDSKWHLLTPGQQQSLRDMEARGIMRSKQLAYFRECAGEAWTEKGLSKFWQSEREKEEAMTASIKRSRAVAAEILADDRQSGVSLEEATAKKLLKIWTLVADAMVDPTTPEGLVLLAAATDGIAALSKAPLKKAELGERKEARLQRERDSVRKFSSKVEAGLKQMEEEAGKNKKLLSAINGVRDALKEAA